MGVEEGEPEGAADDSGGRAERGGAGWMRRRTWIFLLGVAVGAAGAYVFVLYRHSLGPFEGDRGEVQERPWKWAVRIQGRELPNLHRVSEKLYRGAQPRAEGFCELEAMGVRTVVNLRLMHSDKDEMEGTKLSYEHIGAEAWDIDDDDVVRFLKIAADPGRAPVFVHCKYGADRTGAMVGVYGVVVQGWDREEAIREMTTGGFGYHSIWDDPIEYIREMDVQRLKREAGIGE